MGNAVGGVCDGVGRAPTEQRASARPVKGRVCMVVHGPYPIGEPRVARQARAATEAGFEVDLVAMRGAKASHRSS